MARRELVNPLTLAWQVWGTGAQAAMMMAEAQAVIGLRVMGMSGVLPEAPGERMRMFSEKSEAFLASGAAATTAAMSGKRPHQVVDAALRPLRKKTKQNARRLTKSSLR